MRRLKGGMTADFVDYIAVKNCLSLYCVAIDTKDFSLLEEVFLGEAVAQYPFPGGAGLTGWRDIGRAIGERLGPVTTQHALTTQNINFYPDGKSANAMTYFTATHWGKGRWQGELLIAHGKYIDELVRVSPGQWRVRRREVKFMGPLVGEVGVMEPSAETPRSGNSSMRSDGTSMRSDGRRQG